MSAPEKLRLKLRYEFFGDAEAAKACPYPALLHGHPHSPDTHRGLEPSDWRHAIYEATDADGRILYIGRSSRLFKRLQTHRRSALWWPHAASIAVSFVPCAAQSVAYEEARILKIRPPYNQRFSMADAVHGAES